MMEQTTPEEAFREAAERAAKELAEEIYRSNPTVIYDAHAGLLARLVAAEARVEAAEKERDELREEVVENLWETLNEHTTEVADGWRRGNGRSEARYAGNRLVELGLAEPHPENTPQLGRVNRWRRILKQEFPHARD